MGDRTAANLLVCLEESTYLPSLGYIDRIARSDLLIVLDDVNFSRHRRQNRGQLQSEKSTLVKRVDGTGLLANRLALEQYLDVGVVEKAGIELQIQTPRSTEGPTGRRDRGPWCRAGNWDVSSVCYQVD